MARLIPYAGQERASKSGPLGFYERSPNPRIVVTFKQAQFDAVVAYAEGKDISFAKAVRQLVGAGLTKLVTK